MLFPIPLAAPVIKATFLSSIVTSSFLLFTNSWTALSKVSTLFIFNILAFIPICSKFCLLDKILLILSFKFFSFNSEFNITLAAPNFSNALALCSWWFSLTFGNGINIAALPNLAISVTVIAPLLQTRIEAIFIISSIL